MEAQKLLDRILILEKRKAKLEKANQVGLFAFMVKKEFWNETQKDRNSYRKINKLVQMITERKSKLYERIIEQVQPQIDRLIARHMEFTNDDVNWTLRRLRYNLSFDDSLNDLIISESIHQVNQRKQQAKLFYVQKP